MVRYFLVFVLAVLGASALPLDHIIAKLDPGHRYQYMSRGDGTPELVDLWFKISDLTEGARYIPEMDNGYHLFTRANPQVSQPIPLGMTQLLVDSNFDVSKKIVFIVHGWKNTPTSEFNVNMIHGYLNAEDVNLFMVDWSVGADANYVVALSNLVASAEHVAQYIQWLNSASGASLSQYHIIGHSLGAHQVGMIGRHLGGVVPYITALDPALPGFIFNPNRFSNDSAIYTEVMHTNAFVQGIGFPAGDVDFYPNGGNNMPGCEDSHCNHHRTVYYMAESLMSGGFLGRRCESYLQALNQTCTSDETLNMGGTTPKTGHTGIFYVTTNPFSPFSQQ